MVDGPGLGEAGEAVRWRVERLVCVAVVDEVHPRAQPGIERFQLIVGGMNRAGFVQLAIVKDGVHVVHRQLLEEERVEPRVGGEQHLVVDQQAGGPEFRAGAVALGRDVHGAKNNQPDALDLHLVNLAWRLSGLAGEDEIGQVLKLECAVLAVLAPAAKGALPKDALVRLSENEPGSFI